MAENNTRRPKSSKRDRYMAALDNSNIMKPVDELKSLGHAQSDVINLNLKNTSTDSTISLVLGTPLGVSDTYENVPLYDTIQNHFIDNQASIEDNQGANANFIQLLNRRFLRYPVLFESMEIVIPSDTEVNNDQATTPIQRIFVPYNSAGDSQKISGSYVGRSTDKNFTQVLQEIAPVGEFTGIMYDVLPGANININIRLAGYSTSVMKMK